MSQLELIPMTRNQSHNYIIPDPKQYSHLCWVHGRLDTFGDHQPFTADNGFKDV